MGAISPTWPEKGKNESKKINDIRQEKQIDLDRDGFSPEEDETEDEKREEQWGKGLLEFVEGLQESYSHLSRKAQG